MSYQAVSWVLHQAPMLLTDKDRPDSTARLVLLDLAEHADEHGRKAHPSVLHISWATGLDVRTVQRALQRLERAGLIVRRGVSRDGCVNWSLDLSLARPASDWSQMEESAEAAKRAGSEQRAARRAKAAAATSGTQNAGHIEPDVSRSEPVRDAECGCPGRSAARTTNEPPGNHQ